jgi:hypothetical protein
MEGNWDILDSFVFYWKYAQIILTSSAMVWRCSGAALDKNDLLF